MHQRIFSICVVALAIVCFAAGAAFAGTPDAGSMEPAQSARAVEGVTKLANLEALMNILANSFEILSFVAAADFLWGGIAALLRKRGQTAKLLFSVMIIYPILGLATPGLVNWLATSYGQEHLPLIGALVVFLAFLSALLFFVWTFLPSIYAFREKHPKRNWILFFNFFSALPFCWPILLYVALGNDALTGESWTQTIRRIANRTTLWKAGLVLFVLMGALGAFWSYLFL